MTPTEAEPPGHHTPPANGPRDGGGRPEPRPAQPRPFPDRRPGRTIPPAAVRRVRNRGDIQWAGDLKIDEVLIGAAFAIEVDQAGEPVVRSQETSLGIIDGTNRQLLRPGTARRRTTKTFR